MESVNLRVLRNDFHKCVRIYQKSSKQGYIDGMKRMSKYRTLI